MNIIKKQGVGTWLCLAALVLALIGFILYGAAVGKGTQLIIASGSDPFYDMARPEDAEMVAKVVPFGIFSIVFLAAAIVLSQFKLDGVVGKVCQAVIGLIRIAAPAFILITMLYFVYGSFTGLGWTFFSNAELAIYPEAVAVGRQVIVGVVFFALAFIVATVSAYFEIPKKESK